MPSGGADTDAPAPRFSPALAVQKHGSDLAVSLSAGAGSGPWWIAIQKGFGPLYLEQVGLGVDSDGTRSRPSRCCIDGRCRLFGLTGAVDDLQITYIVDAAADFFNPASWAVDLAGLAVSADMAGLTIAGGLLRVTPAAGGDRVPRHAARPLRRLRHHHLRRLRRGGRPDDQFSPSSSFGAVNGPIGGPPAFFVTGIGGGFGINRGLVVPTDLSQFGELPAASRRSTRPPRAGDPMEPSCAQLGPVLPDGARHLLVRRRHRLHQLRPRRRHRRGRGRVRRRASRSTCSAWPGWRCPARGRPGLDRARAAGPLLHLRGRVLVQAQLTDNSWLLYPDVRLTGGFAFVIWFKGALPRPVRADDRRLPPRLPPRRLPGVPRLGLCWQVGDDIVDQGRQLLRAHLRGADGRR